MNNVLTKREYMFVLHVNKQVSSGNINTDVSSVSNHEVNHIVTLTVHSLKVKATLIFTVGSGLHVNKKFLKAKQQLWVRVV